MVWVRLDDGYPEHPKVDRVGPLAAWLNVCAWAYCARNLTDGFVPLERVERLTTVPKPRELAKRLVEARLWEATEGGYMVHDYLDYNPSREQVQKERAATAQRVAQHRYNSRSNSTSNDVTPAVSNVASTAASNGDSTPPPVPGPARPVGPGPVPLPNPPHGGGPDVAPRRAAPSEDDDETTPPKWEEIVPGVHRGRPNGQGEVTLLRVRCPQCEKALTPAEVDEHECIPVGQKIHPHAAPGNLGALLPKRKPRTDDQKAAEAELAKIEREKADRGPVELPPDLVKLDAEIRAKAARNGAKEEP